MEEAFVLPSGRSMLEAMRAVMKAVAEGRQLEVGLPCFEAVEEGSRSTMAAAVLEEVEAERSLLGPAAVRQNMMESCIHTDWGARYLAAAWCIDLRWLHSSQCPCERQLEAAFSLCELWLLAPLALLDCRLPELLAARMQPWHLRKLEYCYLEISASKWPSILKTLCVTTGSSRRSLHCLSSSPSEPAR